jgi:diaminopimelate decarboxylase
LIAAGVVQTEKMTGAVRVNRAGGVGPVASGLSVFGRATEGWVVGNDTLSRTLHQQIENWAETIAVELVKKA